MQKRGEEVAIDKNIYLMLRVFSTETWGQLDVVVELFYPAGLNV